MHGRARPYGVARRAHARGSASLSGDEVHFIQSIADLLAAASRAPGSSKQELLASSAREQRRLGQDLHDGLCQHLAGIEFRNEALARDLSEDDPPAREERSRRSAALLREGDAAGADARARGLAPVELGEQRADVRVGPSWLRTARMLYRSTAVSTCETAGAGHDNEAAATHLYRIAQEAISNAITRAPGEAGGGSRSQGWMVTLRSRSRMTAVACLQRPGAAREWGCIS